MRSQSGDDPRIVHRLDHPSDERVLADPIRRQIGPLGPRGVDHRQESLDQRRCILGHHASSFATLTNRGHLSVSARHSGPAGHARVLPPAPFPEENSGSAETGGKDATGVAPCVRHGLRELPARSASGRAMDMRIINMPRLLFKANLLALLA